jgi:hypothetical protein
MYSLRCVQHIRRKSDCRVRFVVSDATSIVATSKSDNYEAYQASKRIDGGYLLSPRPKRPTRDSRREADSGPIQSR